MHRRSTLLAALGIAALVAPTLAQPTYSWRYYRPTNTGIQGDYCDAVHIDTDGNPWIGGYNPSFEEGGLAKFISAENRWINISNVDYPVIGHPEQTAITRISDIVVDAAGNYWMGTGRGALKFNPVAGPSSLVRFGADNSPLPGGWTEDVEIAPDGSIWFSAYSTVWAPGGLTRYQPATNSWQSWPYGGNIAAQPKPGGGYYLWASSGPAGTTARFDSATQAWTSFPRTAGNPGPMIGKHAVDAAGNVWMYEFINEFQTRLNCRTPAGAWLNPQIPTLPAVNPSVWAARAYGNFQLLIADGSSTIWKFDGSAWQNLGAWKVGAYTDDIATDANGNIWVCGIEGAAFRDVETGIWQRHRVSNNSQYDFFNNDLTIDQATGEVYACANAGTGVGGMVHFKDGRWIGYNQYTYGLGQGWPFPTDNSESIFLRSSGELIVNPMFGSTQKLFGGTWSTIPGGHSTIKGYAEDSLGRLWALGEYFSLGFFNNGSFVNVGIAAWGQRIAADPDRAGTIWANAGYEVVRTDGSYRFSRTIDDIPELTSQSDTFSGLAVDRNGIAWVGCSVQLGAGGTGGGLIRFNANTGAYTLWQHGVNWPFLGQTVYPFAVTPDGKVWMQYDGEGSEKGLCWFDGVSVHNFPAPAGGEPQWGGVPHAGIKDLEVRPLSDGYELWMSCLSRGIAVLKVTTANCPADFNDSGAATVQDIFDFLNAWFAGTPTADFNNANGITVQDIFDFLNAWFAGC